MIQNLQHYKSTAKLYLKLLKYQKKLHYVKIILNSNTKMKTTCYIINLKQVKKVSKVGVRILNTNCELTNDWQTTANSFNNHFLTISDTTAAKRNDKTVQ